MQRFHLVFQHTEICAFPSQYFYDGKLRSPLNISGLMPMMLDDTKRRRIDDKRFWPNRQVPLVFCHVEGAENTLSVRTAEGNEHSKSNKAERDHAVGVPKCIYTPNLIIYSLNSLNMIFAITDPNLHGFGKLL